MKALIVINLFVWGIVSLEIKIIVINAIIVTIPKIAIILLLLKLVKLA